ncbi:MAG: hypothetical protein QOF06_458 [Solirubrobacterales bacterium]|jgi:hypothetical protein|nr:hypothetical protein [Solirubrobacterales bacterium]
MKGLFEAEARQQAIADSLPLLATYFAAADTWQLRTQSAVSAEAEADRELAQAVRLRVLLALGRELIEILERLVEQPSFRYGRRSEYSVGVLSGRLDVARYARGRGQVESPRRYPIHQVGRQLATPENLLGAAALEALLQGLAKAPRHVIAKAGPERREIGEIQAALARLQQLPLLAELRSEGRRNADRRHLERLGEQVERRLERREIAHPDPYRILLRWLADFVSGSTAKPDSQRWSFYDEDFDARLFEIWLLSLVAQGFEEKYGPPKDGQVRPLWERDAKPQAVWKTSRGRVELFVQRDAKTIGIQGRWKLQGAANPLGAKPDLVLRLVTPDLTRYLIVDAKLRRSEPLPEAAGDPQNLPSEAVYKMLGYFEQLRPKPGPAGFLAYYTPGSARTGRLESGSGEEEGDGTLVLAGVDPALVEASRQAVGALTDLVAELLGEPSRKVEEEATALELEAIAQGAKLDEAATAGQAFLQRKIAAGYAARHPKQRQTVEETTRSSFTSEVWAALEVESRLMLVSSEMYALNLGQDTDFSGPLLVLCSACERELNRRLFVPLAEASGDGQGATEAPAVPSHPPLGTGIYDLRKAVELMRAKEKNQDKKLAELLSEANDESQGALWLLLADTLQAKGHKPKKLGPLFESLAHLNGKYRRPSAHDTAIERELWINGRGKILGPTQLLSTVVTTFPLEPLNKEIYVAAT